MDTRGRTVKEISELGFEFDDQLMAQQSGGSASLELRIWRCLGLEMLIQNALQVVTATTEGDTAEQEERGVGMKRTQN